MSVLFAMFIFSLAMSISPGPVNMVILSSGVNYGVKRTLPYVSGATIGFTVLLLCVGLGLFQVINAHPALLKYLALVGSFYIVYIGYLIAASKPEITVKENKIPQFYEGFLLQWLNPKAWIACVSGVSIFSSAESYGPFLTFVSIYFVVCYVSLGGWAVLGHRASVLLDSHFRLRLFNVVTGLLLLVTGGYLGYSQLFVG